MMKKFLNILTSLLTLVLIFTCSAIYAQNPTGGVEGVVTHIDGEPISNVTVSASMESEIKAQTNSDDEGRFTLLLKPGSYKIQFSHVSCEELVKSVNVTNKVKTIDVTLEEDVVDLADIIVTSASRNLNDISRLPSVKGTAIYVSKKNDVILMDKKER